MFGKGQGGIEQALIDYCDALRLFGHEVIALVHAEAAIIPALQSQGITVYTLTNFGAWDPIAIVRLYNALKHIKPDACIAHGNRAISLLRMARAPRIIGAMHNYKIKCESLKFLFYPTQDLLRHLNAKHMRGKHLYRIPNMVRVPAHMPMRTPHAPPVIGTMGRFVAKKGFALFIETLALLKARGIVFKAVLAGGGEEEMALKALAIKRGLDDVLHFAGWIKDKQAFFDSLDLFCLPSYHEPFGIVLLEAMAQGLPVIAADSEGPSEILENNVDGLLVPKDDPEVFADALAVLLANRAHAQKLAEAAYITAKKDYDLPVVAYNLDLALRAIGRV